MYRKIEWRYTVLSFYLGLACDHIVNLYMTLKLSCQDMPVFLALYIFKCEPIKKYVQSNTC
jgi:hypothetical protein